MSDTKRLLVHTANTFVPVSVIIVGVGRANKEKMKILDGDNRTLTSNEGVRAKRDIVQFVGESNNIYFSFLFLKFSDMEKTQKSIIETSKYPVRYNLDTDVPFEKNNSCLRTRGFRKKPRTQVSVKFECPFRGHTLIFSCNS